MLIGYILVKFQEYVFLIGLNISSVISQIKFYRKLYGFLDVRAILMVGYAHNHPSKCRNFFGLNGSGKSFQFLTSLMMQHGFFVVTMLVLGNMVFIWISKMKNMT